MRPNWQASGGFDVCQFGDDRVASQCGR